MGYWFSYLRKIRLLGRDMRNVLAVYSSEILTVAFAVAWKALIETMAGLSSIASDLNKLHENQIEDKADKEAAQTPKPAKSKRKFVIVFWVETKEFNVMALSKIPKECREEGRGITKIRAEGKPWTVKLVQISGKCCTTVVNTCS